MSNKNLEIESLRAIAILMVVVAHFNQFLFPESLPAMNFLSRYLFLGSGVDLFFCISGYVVSKSLFGSIDRSINSGRTLAAFWVRRAFRLLPSAWAWLAISILASIAFGENSSFGTLQENLKSVKPIMLFFANMAQVYNGALGPNVVYWSLATEEQFYFLLPIFVLIVPSQWRWKILIAIVATIFFVHRVGGTYSWFLRVDGLAWGVLIFIFSRNINYIKYEPIFMCNKKISIVTLIFLLLTMSSLPIIGKHFSITYGLVAICSALLVWFSSYEKGYIVGYFTNIMQWLGSRSYAIYLVHIPIFRLTHEIFIRLQEYFYIRILIIFSALMMVAIFSEISFRLLEKPMRKIGLKIANNIINNKPINI